MAVVFSPENGREFRVVGTIPLDKPLWCPATGRDADGLPICGFFIHEVPVIETVDKEAA